MASYDEDRGALILCVAYHDDNDDGFVDGITPPLSETLLTLNHLEGGAYVDRTYPIGGSAEFNVICAAVEHLSEFALALPTDLDRDGCTNQKEVGPNPALGGGRNYQLFWDFFDVPAPPSYTRYKAISVADIAAVVARFGSARPGGTPDKATALAEALAAPPAPPAYHAGYDRTPAGMLSGPPDGAIGVQDISRVVAQFGHSCL
jgi:hypothetical protein